MSSQGGEHRLRPAPREKVELMEGEHVVPRGSARTHWLVRIRDGWVPAASVPGAHLESLDPEPGTVWTRRVLLQLPRGTLLLRVSSTPQLLDRSPLGFLQAGTRAPRRVTRTLHRVGRNGELAHEPEADPRTRR